MRAQQRVLVLLAAVAVFLLAGVMIRPPQAHAQGASPPAGIQASIDNLRTIVTDGFRNLGSILRPPSNNQTRLLFQFVTNQAGFDTGISIANTGADPFGTAGKSGACSFVFYGSLPGGGAAPPRFFATQSIVPGESFVSTLSNMAASFQGYAIAVCNFPLAHGSATVMDLGARNLAFNTPVLVLPSTRSSATIESLGE